MITITVGCSFSDLKSEPIDMDPQKALDMIKESEGSIDFKTEDGRIVYIPPNLAKECMYLIENV